MIDDGFTIKARFIMENEKAWYVDCEGDYQWFPKRLCELDREKEELTAPAWLLAQKFPREKF